MPVRLVGDGTGPTGAASQLAAGGLSLLHPEEQVFDAMLVGWRNQQLARRLAFSTVEQRERMVRAFAAHSQSYPWLWTAQLVDEWMTDLRAVRGVRASTLRGYQIALRLFCSYATDSAYSWPTECEQRFGTHPVQVVHEWNSAVHVQDAESDPSRRAFTRTELQAFFDHADTRVAAIRGAGRKGWLPAFRDATLFKVAYGYGLRRNEARMLDAADFGRNPHAPEFGEYGVCYVRHGKASKGSPPKRRSVLTVLPWTVEVIATRSPMARTCPRSGPDAARPSWPPCATSRSACPHSRPHQHRTGLPSPQPTSRPTPTHDHVGGKSTFAGPLAQAHVAGGQPRQTAPTPATKVVSRAGHRARTRRPRERNAHPIKMHDSPDNVVHRVDEETCRALDANRA